MKSIKRLRIRAIWASKLGYMLKMMKKWLKLLQKNLKAKSAGGDQIVVKRR